MKTCLYTQVYYENILFPIFMKYYSQSFNLFDIYVWHHVSVDEFREDDSVRKEHQKYEHKFNYIYEPRFLGRDENAHPIGTEWAKKLLRLYDVVVYAPCDEFIIPNIDRYKNLREYLQVFKKDYIYATGEDVIQDQDESNIDWTKPVLAQRKYWLYSFANSKPCIFKTVPVFYRGGHVLNEHVAFEHQLPEDLQDKNLLNVHLHSIDNDLFVKRKSKSYADSIGQRMHHRTLIPDWIKTII